MQQSEINITAILSIVAIGVSFASFTISVLNYLRDRAKIRCWSTLYWQDNGPEVSIPALHITVANVGRRPVMVRDLVKCAGKMKWEQAFNPPIFEGDEITSGEQLAEFTSKWMSHSSAVKISEGEFYELRFSGLECADFVWVHDRDIPVQATSLLIKDAQGRSHRVKHSKRDLKKLMEAWHP